jgi:hypothetical protein
MSQEPAPTTSGPAPLYRTVRPPLLRCARCDQLVTAYWPPTLRERGQLLCLQCDPEGPAAQRPR